MAFAFNPSEGNAPKASVGAEVPEIVTEHLGFAAIDGDKKLKLLHAPWPQDDLPSSSASLLAVSSKRGLLAAASPDGLLIASTDSVRKAFNGKADEDNVVSDFSPDIMLVQPQLRHVAFSSGGDYLVVTAESGGGLTVYEVDELLQGNKQPALRIPTDGVSVRALVPGPNPDEEQFFAAVLDSGRLVLTNVAIAGQYRVLREDSVSCLAWSVKGKAILAGLNDGTAVQYHIKDGLMGTIPRPPDTPEGYAVSAIQWFSTYKFFIIHSPQGSASGDDGTADYQDSTYHFVETSKGLANFTFHQTSSKELLYASFGPQRSPPLRFSVLRLHDWEPDLQELLIVAASNCTEFAALTSSSTPLSPEQEVVNDFNITSFLDHRRAALPQSTDPEGGDTVLIGEALDLSSKDLILRPIPSDEEIEKSPTPLPALLALNHEGMLSAWWIVYDKSIRAGTGYPGLVSTDTTSSISTVPSAAAAPPAPSTQTPSVFGQPAATFGTPSTPKFGSTGFPTGNAVFGAPGLGGSSSNTKPAQPAFGSTSALGMGSGSGFGATGALGNRQSPWGSASQTLTSQSAQNPFASAAGGASGFAKFGQPASNSGSAFSSFGSNAGTTQSPFSNLGTQKSAFAATSKGPAPFKGLSTEPSFGSTVTVGSSLGGGSTLPSWANTPAQQGGSMFGRGSSSFASSKESDVSDADEARNRERDEATPTPQAPPPQSKGLFGIPANGFQLGSTFKSDGSANDDLPKPQASSGGSLFGNDFVSALGGSGSKAPTTPIKKEEEQPRLQDISTTPTLPPKPTSFAPSAKQSTEQEKVSESSKEVAIPDDAPLPPDPATSKPRKPDENIPPLAGSPAIKVEAPDSSVPSSPLEGDDDNISVEEHVGDDEEGDEEEPSPSDAARRSRGPKPTWTFQDSVRDSPRILPAAPTPPVVKSGTSSHRSSSPSRPSSRTAQPIFGQSAKTSGPALFQQSTTPFGTAKPPPVFAPPTNRMQEQIRSPSPVRSASTSRMGTRRQQMPTQVNSMMASMQQSVQHPPPQPETTDLEDEEDARIRQELASDIVPNRNLDPLVLHKEFTGPVSKEGIPAQIEILYRDINSMVDAVGLNSRIIASFVKYHAEPERQSEFTLDDLERVAEEGEDGTWFDEWCLAEIDDLKELETELERMLEAGKIQDVFGKLTELLRLLHERAKMMTKINDIRRQIINRKDPEKTEALRKASLPKELADQQKALRNEYARLLAHIGQAEEATMLLRSKLAHHNGQKGRTTAVPTVDAVKKTISKLIAATEKKNNDILYLESQLRKLGLEGNSRPGSSGSRGFATPSRSRMSVRSSAQSPFATPPTSRNRMSLSELNRTVQTPEPEDGTPGRGYGLFYTPDGSPADGVTGSKYIPDLEVEELELLRGIANRRKEVGRLAAKVFKNRVGGVKVTKVT